MVPADPEAPAFKLLGGRLYNAGLKVQSLTEVFAVVGKILQRWGRSSRSGDAEELIRVLAGRPARRKLTVPIKAFVRHQSRPQAAIVTFLGPLHGPLHVFTFSDMLPEFLQANVQRLDHLGHWHSLHRRQGDAFPLGSPNRPDYTPGS